jgi:hypothetical protein
VAPRIPSAAELLRRAEPPRGSEILYGVRGLLAERYRWCKGAAARDANGRRCLPCDVQADAWDVVGAVRKVLGIDVPIGVVNQAAARLLGFEDVCQARGWNDARERVHRDVVIRVATQIHVVEAWEAELEFVSNGNRRALL